MSQQPRRSGRGPHDAVERLNDHHADDLLAIARTLGGQREAFRAQAEGVDHRGLELKIETPEGPISATVPFDEPLTDTDNLGRVRVAFVRLARRARTVLGTETNEADGS